MYTCGGCQKRFSGLSVFDAHRTGSYARSERRCLTTEEMEQKGMRANERGIWKMPDDEKNRERLTRLKAKGRTGACPTPVP